VPGRTAPPSRTVPPPSHPGGDDLLDHRPPPPPKKVAPPKPTGPWLNASGVCADHLRRHDYARAALCAQGKEARVQGRAFEALGDYDAAGAAWRVSRGQLRGQMSVEVMHRANAMAEIELAVGALVGGKRRKARKRMRSAMQTLHRQAGLGGSTDMPMPLAAAMQYGLVLRAARKWRAASRSFADATRGRGWAADRARQFLVRIRSRRQRKGPWPLIERAYGGRGLDQVNAVRPAGGGDLLMAGYVSGPGIAGAQMAIWRTDPSGRTRWRQVFGGAGHDEAHDLVPFADGRVIAVGETADSGGQRDIIVAGFDRNRTVRWHHTFGGPGHDRAVSALARDDGRVWAAAVTQAGTDKADMRLLMIGTDGRQRDLLRLRGGGEDRPAVLLARGPGATLVGSGRSDATAPWEGRILALDAGARVLWKRPLKHGDGCTIEAATAARRAGLIVAARTWQGSAGPRLLLAAYRAGGKLRWKTVDKRLVDVEIGGVGITGRSHVAVLARGRRDDSFGRAWLLGFRGKRARWTTPLGGEAITRVSALLPVGRYGLIAVGAVRDRGAGHTDGLFVRTDR